MLSPHAIPGRNRRANARYPVDAEVSFKLIQQGKVVGRGWGRSVNLSAAGILFKTAQPVSVGMRLEVLMPWPAKLDGRTSLQLRLKGEAVRADGNSVAVRIRAHEFLTRRGPGF